MQDRDQLESAMSRALSLARRSPADDPNPPVGCTIIDPSGRIVAEGWHRGAGTPHAEVDALAHLPGDWQDRGSELTAVVTLEPCNHTGRTGPCALALIEAGIGAVAFALQDPSPLAAGGAATLRAAGVEVVGGILAEEANALLAPWLARHAAHGVESRPAKPSPGGRPRITVKWAQTLDGRAAAADGSSRWITGPEARADVHRRRAAADAILVGTGTLLDDNPALTAREPGTDRLLVPEDRQPVPVIVGHRPIPEGAAVRTHPALHARGLTEPVRLTGDDLAADLVTLAERGIRSVFIEGGPAIISSLLAADLVDELLVYVAPALLGGPRLAITDIGVADIAGIRRLTVTDVHHLGDDLLLRSEPTRSAPAGTTHQEGSACSRD